MAFTPAKTTFKTGVPVKRKPGTTTGPGGTTTTGGSSTPMGGTLGKAIQSGASNAIRSPGSVAGIGGGAAYPIGGGAQVAGAPTSVGAGGVPAYTQPSVPTGATGAVGGSLTGTPTGFAQTMGYRSDAYPGLLSNPEVILADLMKRGGMNPTAGGSGLMAMGTPMMDYLNAIMPLAFGGGMPPNGDVSAINWLAKMGQQGITPGGAGINFGDVMGVLQGLKPTTNNTPGVWEGLFGTGMAPTDQINNVQRMVTGAARGSMPEFFQQAISNAMNAAALQYMQSQYGAGKPQSFQNFIPRFDGLG